MRASEVLLILMTIHANAQQRQVSDAEVMRVHRSAFLIDTHNDVTSRTVKGFDIGPKAPDGHTDLVRLRAGGVGAVFFAAYVSGSYVKEGQSAHRALEMIDTVRTDIVARHPEGFVFARTAAEIEAARKQEKIAALIGIEGGHAIENSLRLLRDFYDAGVRYMTLTHSNTNDWADSSGDIHKPEVKHHNGLTNFGKEVVREMNRLGMIVDISHVSDQTFFDALEVSRAPIFASHSSCRVLANVPRNMTDEMIVALAKRKGLIQINFACEFLSQKSWDVGKVYWAKWEAAKTQQEKDAIEAEGMKMVPRATLADVVAHIDHVVKIAGVDAVGIGSDFDGVTCTPVGLDDNSKFPNLTRALLEKGYSAADIRKIYSGNMLRLMRDVEAAAGR